MIENSDTFATVSTLLAQDPGCVSYVAFGGGHAFVASVTRIANLKGVTDIAYYGDLDDDGLTIPQRANASGTASGLRPSDPPSASTGSFSGRTSKDRPRNKSTLLPPNDASPGCPNSPSATQRPTSSPPGNRLAQEATGITPPAGPLMARRPVTEERAATRAHR
ncbi:Wadjet anti-phage system protein JetD domain-containing protein [Streptomyces noursei]|uniref:Wadjet anti-phage system protein JetD domain-containing protein n=1 Tax=Streptomyces noursei TaxID=1971 RepID=UPI0037DA1DED